MSEPAVGWLGDAATRTAYPHPGPDQHRRPSRRRPTGQSPPTPGLGSWPRPAGAGPGADRRRRVGDRPRVPGGAAAMVVHTAGGPVPTALELALLRRVADTATTQARLDDDGTAGGLVADAGGPPAGPAAGGGRGPARRHLAAPQNVWRGTAGGVLRPLAQPHGGTCARHGDVRATSSRTGSSGRGATASRVEALIGHRQVPHRGGQRAQPVERPAQRDPGDQATRGGRNQVNTNRRRRWPPPPARDAGQHPRYAAPGECG